MKLKQIISNLVSNAIKFTDRGSVTVGVTLQSETRDTVCLSYTITDTGIGISEHEIGKLFQTFSQADASSTRKYGGTGLGLAICKNLVFLMNGNISVSSTKGRGSVFSFDIILEKQTSTEKLSSVTVDGNTFYAKSVRLTSENESESNLVLNSTYKDNPVRILLAEDNEVNIKFFVSLLTKKGLPCDLAKNGEEAVDAYKKNPYDIIFMDCQMPIMDGYEATKRIRKLEGKQKHAIIIALTAYAMEIDKNKSFQSGMDDFINKPISLDQFNHILEKYIPATINKVNEVPTSKSTEVTPTTKYYDETVGLFIKESGFEPELCTELINDFYEHAHLLMNDLKMHLLENNLEGTGVLMHKLKGSAATVRAVKIAELAQIADSRIKDNDLQSLSDVIEQIDYWIDALQTPLDAI
jgi:CheY-like chemotaxis protein/HPt (histidine-containing phosphotransfer) domain-containing protein